MSLTGLCAWTGSGTSTSLCIAENLHTMKHPLTLVINSKEFSLKPSRATLSSISFWPFMLFSSAKDDCCNWISWSKSLKWKRQLKKGTAGKRVSQQTSKKPKYNTLKQLFFLTFADCKNCKEMNKSISIYYRYGIFVLWQKYWEVLLKNNMASISGYSAHTLFSPCICHTIQKWSLDLLALTAAYQVSHILSNA